MTGIYITLAIIIIGLLYQIYSYKVRMGPQSSIKAIKRKTSIDHTALTCTTCVFMKPVRGYGECHRYPPQDGVDRSTHNRPVASTMWPKVNKDEECWCGEWMEK